MDASPSAAVVRLAGDLSLRLTQDGVFIHASSVEWGNATHGCIGLPLPFAKKLFAAMKVGDPVVVTSGKKMDLSHLR